MTFDVHDGEETKLELALEVAPVVALLRIDVPSIDAATVHLRIDDASGRTIHAGHAFRERRDRPFAGSYSGDAKQPGFRTLRYRDRRSLEQMRFPSSTRNPANRRSVSAMSPARKRPHPLSNSR